MNILVVSYGCPSEKYPLNGIFQFDQAKALAAIGNNVAFAAIDFRSVRKWRKWGIYEHIKDNVHVYEFNFPIGPVLPKLSSLICKYGFSLLLKNVIRNSFVPDVIHIHFADTAFHIVDVCMAKGIPYVITEHSSDINCKNLDESIICKLNYVYKNAKAVIAVSSSLADKINLYTGIKPIIIPNIIDLDCFAINKKEHCSFRFIAAGNLVYGKGFDVLIKAFLLFCQKGYDADLLIMGDGPERENLCRLVEDYNLKNKVTFYGSYKRDEFATELNKSDCFVLASRGETFGVVYVEALACGVPVIATKCGGPEDFVDINNGIFIDVDDINGLVEAMIRIKQNILEYDLNKIALDTKNKFSSLKIAQQIEYFL